MFNKIYENIKKFIKEYYKIAIAYLLLFVFFLLELPFYISTPGGLINTKNKINSTFKMKGSLNMAYVSEIHATPATLLYSVFNKDWDIEKEDEVKADNETIEEKNYRNKMLLKEANDISLLVAYKNSAIDYKIENNKVYITYVDKKAKTDLKIGDQILKIDNKKLKDKDALFSYISGKKAGDNVTFEVKDINNKIMRKKATLISINGTPKVGAIVTETFDVKSDKKIKTNFSKTEYGSSGGLMLTLTIYSNLNKIDLTHGKKVVGTGTIDIDGNVGEIGGVKYKLIGAVNNKADVFLVPKGDNYNEAKKIKDKRGFNIDIIPVETFREALNYLEK